MAESDNILTKLQDLLVYLIPQLNKFPRDQKFVLGDRNETKLLNVQEDCLRAYNSRDKRGHLLEANPNNANNNIGFRCVRGIPGGAGENLSASSGRSAPVHGLPQCPERKPTGRSLFP